MGWPFLGASLVGDGPLLDAAVVLINLLIADGSVVGDDFLVHAARARDSFLLYVLRYKSYKRIVSFLFAKIWNSMHTFNLRTRLNKLIIANKNKSCARVII